MPVSSRPSVLLVADASTADSIPAWVAEQFDLHLATDAQTAHSILKNEWIQVLLCAEKIVSAESIEVGEQADDTNYTSAFDGLHFLADSQTEWPDLIRLLLIDHDRTPTAQPTPQALHDAGINNLLTMPWQATALLLALQNATHLFQLQRHNEQLGIELKLRPQNLVDQLDNKRRALQTRFDWDQGIVRTHTSSMNTICDLLHQVAPFDVNVIISGESGTGKELCARAIHNGSLRQDAPFIAENCGALHDELLESELFGHKRGAYTGANQDRIGLFEQANGGTLFLDEIGEVSAAFQVKLLRVLQENEIRPLGSNDTRPVNVRIIAATNKNLLEEVRAGRFRKDLYYRLSTFTVKLPPLRERRMDIAALAYCILQDAMQQLGKKVSGFSTNALACMQAYQWPGNVRELQNEIKRMLVLTQDDVLHEDLLSAPLQLFRQLAQTSSSKEIDSIQAATSDTSVIDNGIDTNEHTSFDALQGSLKERVELLETRILKTTLLKHQGNKSRAAQELGLSRVGLRNKLERYALDPTRQKDQDKEKGQQKPTAPSRVNGSRSAHDKAVNEPRVNDAEAVS